MACITSSGSIAEVEGTEEGAVCQAARRSSDRDTDSGRRSRSGMRRT